MTPQPYTGGAADIRMVVTDMDGTLLDGSHAIPASFWPLLDVMRERGILMVPASGRQHASIAGLFPDHTGMAIIAENGTYVELNGHEVFSATLNNHAVADTLARVRSLNDPSLGIVLCGKKSAYVEQTEPAFVEQVSRYYTRLQNVSNLDDVDDGILKVALFSFEDIVSTVYPHLGGIATDPSVVVSQAHWIDVMDPLVNKGVGLRELQAVTGVSREQTVVFGDYLNDLEMLDEGALSFAMSNAHPEVLRRAQFTAPSNDDAGVVTIVARLLGIDDLR